MSYAQGTYVPVRKSRLEIEDMLEKARATRTYTGMEADRAIVGFELEDRRIQFELTLPSKADFTHRKVRGRRVSASQEQQDEMWEQACRERWRALVLALKSKFVAIETGIETTEQAFLAHVVLANRQTVHQWFKAQIEKGGGHAGPMPPLLASGSPTQGGTREGED